MVDKSDDRGRRLNWRQACAILKCSKTRFYHMIRDGVIQAHRFAGSQRGIWVYEEDLGACIEKLKSDKTDVYERL